MLDAAHALMNQGISRASGARGRSRDGDARQGDDARREHEEATYNDLWRTVPRSALPKAPSTPEARRRRRRAGARPAGGEPALFPREARAEARGLAARAAAHRAHAGAVLLSAAPDQGDERRLRHLRALRDPEPAVRHAACSPKASMLEFMHSHSSVVFQPTLRRPLYQRHQPLCARLRHDARHQADLRGADRGGPRLVSRVRRQRRRDGHAEGGLGQLPRRQLHPAVPVAEADARFPAVRRCTTTRHSRSSR